MSAREDAGNIIVKLGSREKTLPYDATAQDIRDAMNELARPAPIAPEAFQ